MRSNEWILPLILLSTFSGIIYFHDQHLLLHPSSYCLQVKYSLNQILHSQKNMMDNAQSVIITKKRIFFIPMRSKVLPLASLFSLQPIPMLWASTMPCLVLWLRVIIDTHCHLIISDLFLFTSFVSLSWFAFEFAFCFSLLFAWSILLVLDVPVFVVVLSRTSITMSMLSM